MILLHPGMLVWLGGATVPLVLHLLSRSRYRPVPWGAMMFLTGVDSSAEHAAHLKQWTLLALRMSSVGLLALALARPVISSQYTSIPTGGLTTGGPAAVVIILDDSASMGYRKDGKSRLDDAREVTLQILAALKRGDQATLLLAGTHDAQPALPLGPDLQSIAARVADLQPDAGSADFSIELNRAADLLQHAAAADHEIYLITDHQALNWRMVNDAFKQRWLARRSASGLGITVFPVGGDEADNLAIEGFELPDRVLVRDQPGSIEVKVRNYGPTACDSVAVRLWTGVRTLGETTISIPPHATRAIDFSVRFGEAGSRVISGAVTSNGFTSDDRMDYSLDVLDPRVLLVTTKVAASQPSQSVQSLLNYYNRRGSNSSAVLSVFPFELNAQTLKKINVAILDDVPRLSSSQTKALQTFVSSGGGLLILPGSDVEHDLKDNPLYQQQGGLFPATLLPPPGGSAPAQKGIHFDPAEPIFRTLDLSPSDLLQTGVDRFFPVVMRSKDKVRVLARYASDNPFLLEADKGAGKTLLMTTPLDARWNGLAAAGLSQTMLLSIVKYLSQESTVDRNLSLGQPINALVNEGVEDRSATVQYFSTGQREPAQINRVNDQTEIHYSKTGRPGEYRLRYRVNGKEKLLYYVVSAGHYESDLTPLTDIQWRTLAQRVRFSRVNLGKSTVADAISNQRGGREIWIDLLGGVLLLIMIEGLLSKHWSVV